MRKPGNVEIASNAPHPGGRVVQLSTATVINASRNQDLTVSQQGCSMGLPRYIKVAGNAPTENLVGWRFRGNFSDAIVDAVSDVNDSGCIHRYPPRKI